MVCFNDPRRKRNSLLTKTGSSDLRKPRFILAVLIRALALFAQKRYQKLFFFSSSSSSFFLYIKFSEPSLDAVKVWRVNSPEIEKSPLSFEYCDPVATILLVTCHLCLMISRSTQNIQARIINTYNLPFQALLTQPQSLISLLLASTLKFFSGSSYLPPKSPAGFEMQMKLPLGKGHLICDDGKGQGHFFGLETHSSVSGHKYFSHWLSSTFCSYEAGSSDP